METVREDPDGQIGKTKRGRAVLDLREAQKISLGSSDAVRSWVGQGQPPWELERLALRKILLDEEDHASSSTAARSSRDQAQKIADWIRFRPRS